MHGEEGLLTNFFKFHGDCATSTMFSQRCRKTYQADFVPSMVTKTVFLESSFPTSSTSSPQRLPSPCKYYGRYLRFLVPLPKRHYHSPFWSHFLQRYHLLVSNKLFSPFISSLELYNFSKYSPLLLLGRLNRPYLQLC